MSDSASDKEWEELLRQLRTQPPAQPRLYFYNRVQARLAPEVRQSWFPGWVRRPAYALLLGALVLALSGDDPAFAAASAPVAAAAPVAR